MSKHSSLAVVFSFICILSLSSAALGCACCADRGTYIVQTGTIEKYDLDLLKEMRFDTAAELYMTAAGFEDMKGLGLTEKDFDNSALSTVGIVDAFTNNAWRLDFKSTSGKTGVFLLPKPAKMTSRKIDIPDNSSTAPDITVYKEMVFNGSISSGSGFLRGGIIKPTSYTLIFQGHGNMCDNADDFTNWRLEVNGRKAAYVFFGKMKAANKSAS